MLFYSTKTKPPSTHSKHAIEEEEGIESGSLTASDFQTPIIDSQLWVLNKSFEMDMVALFNEFKSAKSKGKRKTYQTTFYQKENGKNEWIACKNTFYFLISLKITMFPRMFQKIIWIQ